MFVSDGVDAPLGTSEKMASRLAIRRARPARPPAGLAGIAVPEPPHLDSLSSRGLNRESTKMYGLADPFHIIERNCNEENFSNQLNMINELSGPDQPNYAFSLFKSILQYAVIGAYEQIDKARELDPQEQLTITHALRDSTDTVSADILARLVPHLRAVLQPNYVWGGLNHLVVTTDLYKFMSPIGFALLIEVILSTSKSCRLR